MIASAARGQGPTADDGEPFDLAVIIPCRNVAATLAEQLDALVAEKWDHPWGIVVVDNDSTDATAAVARRYADRGVRVVEARQGQGVAYARNAGVNAVQARAVAFCDGDDVIHPGWVRAMGSALQDHHLVSGSLETTTLNAPWLVNSRPMGRGGDLPRFGATPFASGGNCGIRRELYERLAGFDENFEGLEDIEFSLRARAAGVTATPAPGAVIAYRMRSGVRDLWRQGLFYGGSQPLLIRRARQVGLPAPSRWQGLRSWAWLVLHLAGLRNRAGRLPLLWVLACRLGVLRRSIQLRSLYV
jgi:glycosyltransferase involved in cell wall biosynthesis